MWPPTAASNVHTPGIPAPSAGFGIPGSTRAGPKGRPRRCSQEGVVLRMDLAKMAQAVGRSGNLIVGFSKSAGSLDRVKLHVRGGLWYGTLYP